MPGPDVVGVAVMAPLRLYSSPNASVMNWSAEGRSATWLRLRCAVTRTVLESRPATVTVAGEMVTSGLLASSVYVIGSELVLEMRILADSEYAPLDGSYPNDRLAVPWLVVATATVLTARSACTTPEPDRSGS